jgi:hypothetical protein
MNEVKPFERLNGKIVSKCPINPGAACSCIKNKLSGDGHNNHGENRKLDLKLDNGMTLLTAFPEFDASGKLG